jgi:hypothetical protein
MSTGSMSVKSIEEVIGVKAHLSIVFCNHFHCVEVH